MRILFVSHSFPLPGRPLSNVGGMQRVAVDLHRALQAHPSIQLDSILLETSWRWTGARTPPFLLGLLSRIPRIVRDRRVDVVLFSSMVTAFVTPMIGDRIRAAGAIAAAIPVGRDVTLSQPIYQRIVPRVLRGLDLVLPISRATAQTCLDRGADPERVEVVPCGSDVPRSPTHADRGTRRSALINLLERRGHQPPTDATLLLSVGRHQERKGFHWFVDEVMPRLPPDAVYLLAGSGPMTGAIEAAIVRNGLQERALVLGMVTDEELSTLYAGADLFVMPNIPVPGDIEGFGVVMVEAGAAGLPVVAADLEGIRDVISEGENGTLVPSGDAAGFAAAVTKYSDPRTLADASERAAHHVAEHFGWPAIVDRYLRIFDARLARSAEKTRSAAQDG